LPPKIQRTTVTTAVPVVTGLRLRLFRSGQKIARGRVAQPSAFR
jgi:hypothetical protein